MDNNIDNFNKDIVLTATNSNFFYDDYSVKYFMTLNRLIPIETTKNIVISINNNAFVHSLTGSTEPGGMEPSGIKPSSTESSTARHSNKVNTENLTVNIDFLDCHFDNNR